VQPEDEKRMKIDLQRQKAQGKYDAEYEQLKWIDNIMDSDDDHPDFSRPWFYCIVK
jgi:hypothetical protein